MFTVAMNSSTSVVGDLPLPADQQGRQQRHPQRGRVVKGTKTGTASTAVRNLSGGNQQSHYKRLMMARRGRLASR